MHTFYDFNPRDNIKLDTNLKILDNWVDLCPTFGGGIFYPTQSTFLELVFSNVLLLI